MIIQISCVNCLYIQKTLFRCLNVETYQAIFGGGGGDWTKSCVRVFRIVIITHLALPCCAVDEIETWRYLRRDAGLNLFALHFSEHSHASNYVNDLLMSFRTFSGGDYHSPHFKTLRKHQKIMVKLYIGFCRSIISVPVFKIMRTLRPSHLG